MNTAQSKQTLPALAFVFPYHEMLMRGLLRVGDFSVKTRSNNWSHRGLVLLYTSHGRYHKVPARVYNLNPNEFASGAIVGVATMVDSRPLTWQEKIQITCNFNKVNQAEAEEMLLGTDGDYVTPLPIGIFLKDVRRFKTPVPFKPKPGSIGIMRVSMSQVAKALKQAGVDPKNSN